MFSDGQNIDRGREHATGAILVRQISEVSARKAKQCEEHQEREFEEALPTRPLRQTGGRAGVGLVVVPFHVRPSNGEEAAGNADRGCPALSVDSYPAGATLEHISHESLPGQVKPRLGRERRF